jgi:hypothetical protein
MDNNARAAEAAADRQQSFPAELTDFDSGQRQMSFGVARPGGRVGAAIVRPTLRPLAYGDTASQSGRCNRCAINLEILLDSSRPEFGRAARPPADLFRRQ